MRSIVLLLATSLLCGCIAQAANASKSPTPSPQSSSASVGGQILTIGYPGQASSQQEKPYSIPWPRDEHGGMLTGTTTVMVRVDATGRVSEAKVEKSSGYEALDAAALEGVRRWHFNPAKKNGVPVASYARIPIVMEPDGILPSNRATRAFSNASTEKGGELVSVGVISTERPLHYSADVDPTFAVSQYRLAAAYNQAIANTIERLLNEVRVPAGQRCDVDLVILPSGLVLRVEPGQCSFSQSEFKAVDDALVNKLLPYRGYESVFQRNAHVALCSPRESCDESRDK